MPRRFLFQKDTNGRSSILNSSKPIRDVEDPGSKFRRRADVGKLSSSSGWVIVINKKTQGFSLHFLGFWVFFGVPVAMNSKPSLSLKAPFSGKGGGGPTGQPQARCVLVNSLRWSCQEMAKSYVHLWGVASGSNLPGGRANSFNKKISSPWWLKNLEIYGCMWRS